jgi:hypothetical protein
MAGKEGLHHIKEAFQLVILAHFFANLTSPSYLPSDIQWNEAHSLTPI